MRMIQMSGRYRYQTGPRSWLSSNPHIIILSLIFSSIALTASGTQSKREIIRQNWINADAGSRLNYDVCESQLEHLINCMYDEFVNLGDENIFYEFQTGRFSALGRRAKQRLSIFSDKGDTVILGCAVCLKSTEKDSGVKWWKLSRARAARTNIQRDFHTEFIHAEEVDIDIHEDTTLNRVYVGDNHELIIKAVQPGDEGHYFCQRHTKVSELEGEARKNCWEQPGSSKCQDAQDKLAEGLVKTKVTMSARFTLVYNLDIELKPPSVKKVGKHLGVDAYPHITRRPSSNLVMYSQWSRWSLCNAACNQTGYRQRRGKCVAKKLDPGEKAMPFIVELVMIDNEDSKVACHSTLFREISDIYSIPDEMEYEVCNGTCSGYEDVVSNEEGYNETKPILTTQETKFEMKKLTLKADIGSRLVLRCPGANDLEKPVTWFNESKVMGLFVREQTKSRVDVTGEGDLIINPVAFEDGGRRFACWVNQKARAIYILDIEPPETVGYSLFKTWVVYLMIYELALFFVLLLILLVRHGTRKKQRGDDYKKRGPLLVEEELESILTSSSDLSNEGVSGTTANSTDASRPNQSEPVIVAENV